jgi:hypothetical protein
MTLTRLKATHEAVERIKQLRRTLPPLPGLNDYRAIFHAHAEDSAHTGGTRSEMLADARRSGVSIIFLSDHYRPPRDFIRDSWRGLRDGVLFIPGSEVRGLLIHPMNSVLQHMEAPITELIGRVSEGEGLAFLSHIEERPDHFTSGLTGMEIYNRHADAKRDLATLLSLAMQMTDPKQLAELKEALRLYPDELLAAQVEYPAAYLEKWDGDCQQRRLTGVGANDCHHNQVFIVKMVDQHTVKLGTTVDEYEKMRTLTDTIRPGIPELTTGRKPGDVLAELDFDPYHRSFSNVSTHVLASELGEGAVRNAVKAGHVYVSHDWMCDPTGFRFLLLKDGVAPATGGKSPLPETASLERTNIICVMGDEVRFEAGLRISTHFPVQCRGRLLRDGKPIHETEGTMVEAAVTAPGVYRIEGRLMLGDEERPWIFSNPIYVR